MNLIKTNKKYKNISKSIIFKETNSFINKNYLIQIIICYKNLFPQDTKF